MSSKPGSEVWMSHDSFAAWTRPAIWSSYLQAAERVLGIRITHLDDHDPVRRRIDSVQDAGEYIGAFGKGETSRSVHGRAAESRCSFTVNLTRTRFNNIIWTLPTRRFASTEGMTAIKRLFQLGIDHLLPFYSFSDFTDVMVERGENHRLSMEEELIGIFWLNQLGSAYEKHFGERRLSVPGLSRPSDDYVIIDLGPSPAEVPAGLRSRVERMIGEEAFVGPDEFGYKLIGQHVPSYQQIRDSQKQYLRRINRKHPRLAGPED